MVGGQETVGAARRGTRAWLLCGGAITACAACVAPLDLPADRALFAPESRFGALVFDYGTLPALALYAIAAAWLTVPALRSRSRLASRAAAAVLVQGLVHTMFAMNALKLLWGRERFAALAAGEGVFSPLWAIHPGADGTSFPSGHVATALVLLPVALLLAREGSPRAGAALAAWSAVYASAIGLGRMLLGAHFASDVVFAAGTAVLMAPASVAIGDSCLSLYDRFWTATSSRRRLRRG